MSTDFGNSQEMTIEELHAAFVEAKVFRAYVLFREGSPQPSNPELLSHLAELLRKLPDFASHEALFIGRDERFETLFFAFVHDTRRGLAQGGLRFKEYSHLSALLSDGLSLSRGMTRKNALAGLWWGGGKGIIAKTLAIREEAGLLDPLSPRRKKLFGAYGQFVASLGGVYYTAEDIGTKTADMNAILRRNRFVTCLGRELGGSGNPSPHTARGVLSAMKAGWQFLTGSDALSGVRVAVQGVGNVGGHLVRELDHAGAKLVISEINAETLEDIRCQFPHATVVGETEIFDVEADIFAPCAIGKQMNRETIPRLKVRMVCGAANNILEEGEDARRLQERGILYIPDYLANRTGIINCSNEWQGYLEQEIEASIALISDLTRTVLEVAREDRITPSAVADRLADAAACEPHPMLGNRGRLLIDQLVQKGWHAS